MRFRPPASRDALRRVSHILDSVAEEASGPSYSVPALCRGLAEAGWRPTLLTIGEPGADEIRGCPHRRFAQDSIRIPVLRSMRRSLGLKRAIDADARDGAILHAHGLWLMANIYPGWAARRFQAPFVLSPRGMLGGAALAFSSSRKRAMWSLLQGRAARSVSLFHATSEEEFQDIRRFGLKQPVAVIPNGIHLPDVKPSVATGDRRTVLSLGRLHPKKGLDKLLAGWRDVQSAFPDWDLVVAGPSEGGYIDELKRLVVEWRIERVSFPGPLYGDRKVDAYRNASLFVMTTLNENFGMTVAEALSLGVPVICTKGAPWSGLDAHGCGWWVEDDPESIASAMRGAMRLRADELRDMGMLGRDWMSAEFSWRRIAGEMADVYEWLQRGGRAPSSVRED